MLIKYTYAVTGDIYMPEHWPISWDGYQVTWTVEADKASAVSIAVRTDDISGMPLIEKDPEVGIRAHIHIGAYPHRDEEEDSILRTACGLLGFFARAEIDFDQPTVEWIPETPEEQSKLHLHSFKTGLADPPEPIPITYEIVARCFLSAISMSEREVPLSFMAKGRRELKAGRYIDAFYNFFFFFETQFAPGFSDPKKVIAKFLAQPELIAAIPKARKIAVPDTRRVRDMSDLLNLTDDKLVERIVQTRGRLHHHALPRKDRTWHPEKHGEFEADARFLSYLAFEVAQTQFTPVLFDESITTQMREGAKREGAIHAYLVKVAGGDDRQGLNGLPSLHVEMPGRLPSHYMLATLEDSMRREGGPWHRMAVRSYEC